MTDLARRILLFDLLATLSVAKILMLGENDSIATHTVANEEPLFNIELRHTTVI
jgi:hypothetical protein